MKAKKTPNKSNMEASLILPNIKPEAKSKGRNKLVTDYEIKYKLQSYLKDIYKFYSFILRSNNNKYVDYKFKISERILDKFVPDLKTTDERPNVSNFQFVIGYDTKQIESMDSKALEGQVEASIPIVESKTSN